MSGLRSLELQLSYSTPDNPLRTFYIPALTASQRYDRIAGYFSSYALALAATGVAALIQNGGSMRLLVGAQLSPEDADAIQRGEEAALAQPMLAGLADLADALVRQRVEALAWLVANGRLAIKVVVQEDEHGRAQAGPGYFHEKGGVFEDIAGDRVAFTGSSNETFHGWAQNFERWTVFRSWDASSGYVDLVAQGFEDLWANRQPGWRALSIPAAVEQALIRLAPTEAPKFDPLAPEKPVTAFREPAPGVWSPQQERVIFQFLRDAPHMGTDRELALHTANLRPWPHQRRVYRSVTERWPERFLLADEVGLGKTIEAGLVIRELLMAGLIKRCLILAPKSVIGQWRDELYEKFALRFDVYDGAIAVPGRAAAYVAGEANPWSRHDLLLASAQMAKRSTRADALIEGKPWDLVVLDEAHHARRREFQDKRLRPNQLLSLLQRLRDHTRGLLLLTATPMQLEPVEVWDLLSILGLGGRWGAGPEGFLRFYRELRGTPDSIDWAFLAAMLKDYLAQGGERDAAALERLSNGLSLASSRVLRGLLEGQAPETMPDGVAVPAVALAARHTPLRRSMFRNTRGLLRSYRARGVISEIVPTRKPEEAWIPFPQDSPERRLYEDVEDYICDYYAREEGKSIGFILTVYRKRLTSSFYALRRSLERRRDYLLGKAEPASRAGLLDEDLEDDELGDDFDPPETQGTSPAESELQFLDDLIGRVRELPQDPKFGQLVHDLQELRGQRTAALVFTQYTDTMDYLRDELSTVFGPKLGCFSGRGGELWDGTAWRLTTKEDVKTRFAAEKIEILLCSEAAAEGLNLQTCGVLINYDMPWNPMKVEQRIGRIDRIGQKFEEIWIRHYFIEDTVEAEVYKRLGTRIGWFQDVVGSLQPILARATRIIEVLALLPRQDRQGRMARELLDLEKALEDADQAAIFELDEQGNDSGIPAAAYPPVSLSQLEETLTTAETTKGFFTHGPQAGVWQLRRPGAHPDLATFSPLVFEAFPEMVRFLTYTDPALEEILQVVDPPGKANEGSGILRITAEGSYPLARHYLAGPAGPIPVRNLDQLQAILRDGNLPPWRARDIEQLHSQFEREVESHHDAIARRDGERLKTALSAAESRGRRILVEATLIQIALQRTPRLGEEGELWPFSQEAIGNLQRAGYPFAALLQLLAPVTEPVREDDQLFRELQGKRRVDLDNRWANHREQAVAAVQEIVQLRSKARPAADALRIAAEVLPLG